MMDHVANPGDSAGRGNGAGRAAEILTAAATLFAADGVDNTSMRKIADLAGINVGGIYYYFESKDLLLAHLLSSHLRTLIETYDAGTSRSSDPEQQLRAIVLISFQVARAQPDITKVYQSESRVRRQGAAFDEVRDLSAQAQRRWTDAIEFGQRSGVLRSDVPSRVFHRFLRDAVWLSTYWAGAHSPYTAEELADYCLTVFVHGMATRDLSPS